MEKRFVSCESENRVMNLKYGAGEQVSDSS